MARTDIANYLRLAPETVSRVLRRFQEEGAWWWTGVNSNSSTPLPSKHWPLPCCAAEPRFPRLPGLA